MNRDQLVGKRERVPLYENTSHLARRSGDVRPLKKVVNGLLYDTDTADMIAEPLGNLDAFLFRTKNKRWFLYKIYLNGVDLWPINEDEAKERLADDSRYAEFFGEPQPA